MVSDFFHHRKIAWKHQFPGRQGGAAAAALPVVLTRFERGKQRMVLLWQKGEGVPGGGNLI
jgi:hypothetical protein